MITCTLLTIGLTVSINCMFLLSFIIILLSPLTVLLIVVLCVFLTQAAYQGRETQKRQSGGTNNDKKQWLRRYT